MIKLVKFIKYLQRSAVGNASPVSIKAQDLDDNFLAVTVNDSGRGVYKSEYTPLGTELIFRTPDAEASWQELTVSDGQGGTKTLSVLGTPPDTGTATATCLTPFHICVRPDGDNGFYWGVSGDSVIYTDFTASTTVSFSGLVSGNSGWNTVSGTTKIWVQWSFSSEDPTIPTSASVESGSSLPSSNAKLIGSIDSNATVHQVMVGAQRFVIRCLNGSPLAFLVPY